jgi:hypothetical protein
VVSLSQLFVHHGVDFEGDWPCGRRGVNGLDVECLQVTNLFDSWFMFVIAETVALIASIRFDV